jgi:RimK family alpha-L-glutamate ligase
MRLGVLCSPESWYYQDLRRAAADRHQLSPLSFSRMEVELGGAGTSRQMADDMPMSAFDAILVRTMPPGTLEQVVFRMDVLAQLEAAGTRVINPPKAVEIAVDKYLAQAKLQTAGLNTPRTVACQIVDEAMAGFELLGGDVVVKPIFGGEGRGMMRISDADLALRAFKTLEQIGAVIFQQEFIEHEGFDIRVLVIGKRLLAMRRRNASDWRTNVSRGAIAEPFELDQRLEQIAHTATKAVGGQIVGVDILPARDGRLLTLEVNAVPGWRAMSRALNIDVAGLVVNYVEQTTTSRDLTK